jgi:hypothetical protein
MVKDNFLSAPVVVYFTPDELEKIQIKSRSKKLADFCHDAAVAYESQTQIPRFKRLIISALEKSCMTCLLVGGILLASRIPISGYGFIFLALSSSQLFVAGVLEKKRKTILYAASLFLFVDSIGVYRWVLS